MRFLYGVLSRGGVGTPRFISICRGVTTIGVLFEKSVWSRVNSGKGLKHTRLNWGSSLSGKGVELGYHCKWIIAGDFSY